ncbi:zinc finger MYM-type protein 1-like [Brachypodium distachyon]|uniref:zinc finger MYM-type protein 1-like n=1 Tax=Brachypodium distachyon TaxID=15368 RepID=UPI000D0D6FF0|nr:zinc finger MYM-type protein 1-like [Brachypodium distachyon]|eukprot:XP_024312396.1 zinc finger MYM-type protein 1-like [Brachypodium distachyon]
MKRKNQGFGKTPSISCWYKPVPVASNSSSSIPAVQNIVVSSEEENANPSEEEHPSVDDNSTDNPIDMQTDDQNIVASVEVSEQARVGSTTYERDPGKRQQIWELPLDKQEEARRFYISEGPFQPYMANYPHNEHRRRVQYSYFTNFSWLEYSLVKHHAYCLPCFLFTRKPNGRCGSDTFTIDGFLNWKKVNAGKNCAFLTHMGKDSNSAHNFSVRSFHSLKNSMTHIDKAIVQASAKMIGNARQRLKVTIDSIRWLTFQACAFRGHDESPGSINQGNFLELIKLLALYNKEVNEVVLQNAPRNAKYTSGEVQQEILQLLSRRVQKNIIEEIGTSKFCIMVDEARNESKKEQMALVIRFVNKEGFIKERFLDVIHVKDIVASTLKDAICAVLVDNNLNVQDIRGQGYDGASNMRGEWNGLKALILNECPYAYYVHCMAHQLQLALVAASREVPDVHNFFQHANFIINVVSASSKHNDELLAKQAIEIAREIELGELDRGKGANQIGSL